MSEFSFVVMMEVILCLEDPHNLHPMILYKSSVHISAPFQELLFLPLNPPPSYVKKVHYGCIIFQYR